MGQTIGTLDNKTSNQSPSRQQTHPDQGSFNDTQSQNFSQNLSSQNSINAILPSQELALATQTSQLMKENTQIQQQNNMSLQQQLQQNLKHNSMKLSSSSNEEEKTQIIQSIQSFPSHIIKQQNEAANDNIKKLRVVSEKSKIKQPANSDSLNETVQPIQNEQLDINGFSQNTTIDKNHNSQLKIPNMKMGKDL
eukprot:403339338